MINYHIIITFQQKLLALTVNCKVEPVKIDGLVVVVFTDDVVEPETLDSVLLWFQMENVKSRTAIMLSIHNINIMNI